MGERASARPGSGASTTRHHDESRITRDGRRKEGKGRNAVAELRALVLAAVVGSPALVHTAGCGRHDRLGAGRRSGQCRRHHGLRRRGDGYQIAKYEVTNAQYAEFLNAVADTDPYGLYNPNMGARLWAASPQPASRAASPTRVIPGREDMPVNFVSFYDALRFANWLHNGQPTGAQNAAHDRGRGLHDHAHGIATTSIARNAGATIFLTSEDEWYKAAYYDARSRRATSTTRPARTRRRPARRRAPTANTANCDSVVGDLTDVGQLHRARRARTAPSTRAATSGSGPRPSRQRRVPRAARRGVQLHPDDLDASIQRLGTPDRRGRLRWASASRWSPSPTRRCS